MTVLQTSFDLTGEWSALLRERQGRLQLVLLCIAKAVRTFGFGCVSVVLALFLLSREFSALEVGAILTATLIEDAMLTTLISLFAARIGYRRILLFSSAAIFASGIVIALVTAKPILFIACIVGIISPSGFEGGPFAAIEQALLAKAVSPEKLTAALSYYNLAGFAGAALGALAAGLCVQFFGPTHAQLAYQSIFFLYAMSGIVLGALYLCLKIAPAIKSVAVDRAPAKAKAMTIATRSHIAKLASLQSLDAFGGGFVIQSLITLWFYERYHVGAEFLGPVLAACNIIAALSLFGAPYLTKRIGLLRTMVFTHLPCSLTLCLFPLLPSASLAALLLIARSFFSSMDIPVRQAYTMLIVEEESRVSASAIITAARAVAQATGPVFSAVAATNIVTGAPFFVAGICKSVYDVALFACFRKATVAGEGEQPKRCIWRSSSCA